MHTCAKNTPITSRVSAVVCHVHRYETDVSYRTSVQVGGVTYDMTKDMPSAEINFESIWGKYLESCASVNV